MGVDLHERELVSQAQHGDERAFAALVEGYRSRIWSICLRITGNQQDAEDALQDALAAAWLHITSFRGESKFGTWVYRIAANASRAVVRRRRDLLLPDLGIVHSGREADFSDAHAVHDAIARAMHSLPPSFREALVLREYGDFTYEEIARHQQVPVQTVKSRLHRARAAVAAILRS